MAEKNNTQEPEWDKAKKYFDLLHKSMLFIKSELPHEAKKHAGKIGIGLVRAVNDLEAATDLPPEKRDQLEIDKSKEDPVVTKARELARKILIGGLGSGTDDDKKAAKHIENYLRLVGVEKVAQNITNISEVSLEEIKNHYSTDYIQSLLKNFDMWRDSYNKPENKISDRASEIETEISDITKNNLNTALSSFLERFRQNSDSSDNELVLGMIRGILDLHAYTDIGIIANRLQGKEVGKNEKEIKEHILEINKKKSDRFNQIRLEVRNILNDAFKKSFKESRKKYGVRQGSNNDVQIFINGLLIGGRNRFLDDRVYSNEFLDELSDHGLLAREDVQKVKDFRKDWETNWQFINSIIELREGIRPYDRPVNIEERKRELREQIERSPDDHELKDLLEFYSNAPIREIDKSWETNRQRLLEEGKISRELFETDVVMEYSGFGDYRNISLNSIYAVLGNGITDIADFRKFVAEA